MRNLIYDIFYEKFGSYYYTNRKKIFTSIDTSDVII